MDFQGSLGSHRFSLSAGELHVWSANLDLDLGRLNVLKELLSDDEQARAGRFRFWRDQRRFIAGRGILRQLISRYFHIHPRSIEFHYSEFGKPFVLDGDLGFNLAHSQDSILYGFCLSKDIGVDLEYLRPIEDVTSIASRYFSPAETRAILGVPVEQQNELFLSYWTLKEAYIKAIGQGLSYPLDAFEVSIPDLLEPRLLEIHGDDSSSIWSLFSLRPEANYVAAVAARGESWRLTLQRFEG